MIRRKATVFLLAAVAALVPAQAAAQVYAQLGPAEILDHDLRVGVFGLAGDDQVGALADARFLLTLGLDLGLQFGVRSFSNVEVGETVFDGGVDLRYGLLDRAEDVPFDVSVGGGFGVTTGDDRSRLSTVFQASISRELSTSRRRAVIPYAGIVLTIARDKVDFPDVDDEFSDPDLDVSARLGLSVGLSSSSTLTGELQVKEDPAVYLGLTSAI